MQIQHVLFAKLSASAMLYGLLSLPVGIQYTVILLVDRKSRSDCVHTISFSRPRQDLPTLDRRANSQLSFEVYQAFGVRIPGATGWYGPDQSSGVISSFIEARAYQ